MKVITALAAVAFLTACEPPAQWETDQAIRAELFFKCLEKTPTSPTAVGEDSEWSDVVGECNSAAYQMSQRRVK